MRGAVPSAPVARPRHLKRRATEHRKRRQRLLATGFEALESRCLLALTFSFNFLEEHSRCRL